MNKIRNTDAVVIGGGLIGAAVAYYLSKENISVTVLEQCGIASGTSGACSGKIWFSTKKPGLHLELALVSSELHRQLADELEYPVEQYDKGEMLLVETETELQFMEDFVKEQQQAGIEIGFLTKREIREMQPFLAADRLAAVTYNPMGMSINSMSLNFGLLKQAEKMGATVLRDTVVENIRMVSSGVQAVLTSRGEIETRYVINAAGVLAPAVGTMAGLQVPITPIRGQILVTEPIKPIIRVPTLEVSYLAFKRNPNLAPKSEKVDVTCGLSQNPKGNVYIAVTKEFVGLNNETTPIGMSMMARRALDFFPGLSPVKVIRSYAGLRPYTADGLPIMGTVPGMEGFIMATGHGGDGVTLAPVTGKLISELIIRGEPSICIDELSLARFNNDSSDSYS
jgi:sarcosine oxidase subunit beta